MSDFVLDRIFPLLKSTIDCCVFSSPTVSFASEAGAILVLIFGRLDAELDPANDPELVAVAVAAAAARAAAIAIGAEEVPPKLLADARLFMFGCAVGCSMDWRR